MKWLWIILLISNVAAQPTSPITYKGGVPEGLPGVSVINGDIQSNLPSVNVLKCILKRANLDVKWAEYPTRRVLLLLQKGELDLGYPMGFTTLRSLSMIPSETITSAPDLWVYSSLNKPDLKDRQLSIGVKAGSPQYDWVRENGYINIQVVPQYSSLLPMLRKEHVSAVIIPTLGDPKLEDLLPDKDMLTSVSTIREGGAYFSKDISPEFYKKFNSQIVKCPIPK